MPEKLCGRCRELLDTVKFSSNKCTKDALSVYCKPCSSELKKISRSANLDATRARERKRVRIPGERREAQQKWREANRLLANARAKASREKKLEYYREQRRKHKLANPEKVRAYDANRRALKLNAPGNGWTEADVETLLILQEYRCAICSDKLKDRFHRDHIMPLKLGGAHDANNLQLLCEPCNLSKGARHPDDHARALGLQLSCKPVLSTP